MNSGTSLHEEYARVCEEIDAIDAERAKLPRDFSGGKEGARIRTQIAELQRQLDELAGDSEEREKLDKRDRKAYARKVELEHAIDYLYQHPPAFIVRNEAAA